MGWVGDEGAIRLALELIDDLNQDAISFEALFSVILGDPFDFGGEGVFSDGTDSHANMTGIRLMSPLPVTESVWETLPSGMDCIPVIAFPCHRLSMGQMSEIPGYFSGNGSAARAESMVQVSAKKWCSQLWKEWCLHECGFREFSAEDSGEARPASFWGRYALPCRRSVA